MAVSTNDIQWLRQETGVGMLVAKKALEAVDGKRDKALEALRKAGAKIAAAKSERTVKDGAVGCYIHANHKVGALVALACETDFVARTEYFRALAHDLALHVAATNPQYLNPESVPAEVVRHEEDIYLAQLKSEGKPEAMRNKILSGKMEKFYGDVCLLNQPFVKDDSHTVGQLLEQAVARLGENIQIAGFHRLSV